MNQAGQQIQEIALRIREMRHIMGYSTEEMALEDAKKKFVGENPNILALPRAFTTAAVHLCMKNPEENSHSRDGVSHPCGG